MKLKIDKREFLNALKFVSKNINKQNSIAILDCVLLSVYPDNINVLSNNGETQINIDVPTIESEGEGSIAFKPSELIKVLGSVYDENIEINVDAENNTLTVIYEGGRYSCQCLDAADYPKPDFVSGDTEYFTVPFTKFMDMVKYASVFCSADDIRPVIKCIYATIENEELTLASTDMHVCFYTTHKIGYGGTMDFLISPATIAMLNSLTSGYEVQIGVGERHIYFGIDKVSILSQKVQGKFPNFKAVFPKESKSEVIMSTKKLESAIKRAMTASYTTSLCVMKIDSYATNAIITAEDNDRMSKGVEEVEKQGSGNDIIIGFSGVTMLKCLSVLTSPSVLMKMSDNCRPIEIVDSTDTSKHIVMMPMIIQEN